MANNHLPDPNFKKFDYYPKFSYQARRLKNQFRICTRLKTNHHQKGSSRKKASTNRVILRKGCLRRSTSLCFRPLRSVIRWSWKLRSRRRYMVPKLWFRGPTRPSNRQLLKTWLKSLKCWSIQLWISYQIWGIFIW